MLTVSQGRSSSRFLAETPI